MRLRKLRGPVAVLIAVTATLVGITIFWDRPTKTITDGLPHVSGPTAATSMTSAPTTTRPEPTSTTRPEPVHSTVVPTTTTRRPSSQNTRATTSSPAHHVRPKHRAATTSPPAAQPPTTWSEQGGNHAGIPTFADTDAAQRGPDNVEYAQIVQVSCKVLDPSIPSVSPDGYWYRIASPPWNDGFYAAANTFTNGDVLGDPNGTHFTDMQVADC